MGAKTQHRCVRATLRAKILCVLLAAVCQMTFAQDGENAVTARDDEAWSLLEKMFGNAEAIRTCVFDGQETITTTDSDGLETQTRASFRGALDELSGRIRFDYRRTRGPERVFHYIESPEERTVYSEVTGFQITKGPVEDRGDRPDEFFDVRCIGPFSSSELQFGLLPELQNTFIEITESCTLQPLDSVRTIELTRTVAKGLVQVRHVLAPNKGFSPVLMEKRYVNEDGTLTDLKHRLEVTWENVSDVWLPTSATFTFNRQTKTVRQLKFQWQQVNGKIDSTLFERGSLELAVGTKVVDQKTDPSVPRLVYEVGPPLSESPPPGPNSPSRNSHMPTGSRTGTIILILLAVLALIGGLLQHRWRST